MWTWLATAVMVMGWVGPVLAILVGGFIAILLIDLLFDWFDGIRAWWTKRQQVGDQRVQIDRETQREVQRLARLVPTAQSAPPLGGGQARPRGVSRSFKAARNVDAHATPELIADPWQAARAGCECAYCCNVRARLDQPAASGRGPGRGDPTKGLNGNGV